MRQLPLVACALLLLACTSDTSLGYWKGAGLVHPIDASSAMQPDPDAPDSGYALPDGASYVDGAIVFPERVYPLCLRNPSLDGLPFTGDLHPATWWPADTWDLCFNDVEDFPPQVTPDISLSAVTIVSDATPVDLHDGRGALIGALPPASHGVGYLHFDNLRGLPERTSQEMCATLKGGERYTFAIDLASRVGQVHAGTTLARGQLEIYFGDAVCAHAGEPAWTSPLLSSEWTTYCVELTPPRDVRFITLQLGADRQAPSAIIADNIRLDPSCE